MNQTVGILFSILILQVCGAVDFPSTYHAKGTLELPYAELKEPFEIWYDEANNRMRIDYYNGQTQSIVYGSNGSGDGYGHGFLIAYEVFEKVCLKVEGSEELPAELTSFIPDLSKFTHKGSVNIDNKEMQYYYSMQKMGQRENYYKFYYYTDGNGNNIPYRLDLLGYDFIIGSHYDHYKFNFDSFDTNVSDANFEVQKSYTCKNFPTPPGGMLRLNPFREFLWHGVPLGYTDDYLNFINHYGKDIKDLKDFTVRSITYRTNMRYINSHNRKGMSFKLEENHLTDEFPAIKQRNGLLRTPRELRPKVDVFEGGQLRSGEIPDSLDWRLFGAVSPVKDQATCGSCWSFGSTGAIEGAYFLKHKVLKKFSEQNLMDCSWPQGNNACDGGEQWRAFEYVINNTGLMSERGYGHYLGQDGKCHFNKSNVAVSVQSYVNVKSGDENALKEALNMYGPLSVSIDASHPSLSFYANGVYNEPACKNSIYDLDHAVLLVGYGTLEGKDYWLVKNSWSTNWGNDGYVLMARNQNNMCGIATDASYVTVA